MCNRYRGDNVVLERPWSRLGERHMNKESDDKRIVLLMEDDAIVGYFPAGVLRDMIRDWVANAPKGVSRDFMAVGEFSFRDLLDGSTSQKVKRRPVKKRSSF